MTCAGTDWRSFDVAGVSILEVDRHDKKLRRGVHKANRFRIAVRGINATQAQLDPWLNILGKRGVPNYFGEQRFGRNGSNMSLARELFAGKRMKRNKQNIAVSAARSYLFNEILHSRVCSDSWDKAVAGEAFNLDGTNSIFVDDTVSAELTARLESLDIHPTAALWGKGELISRGDARNADVAVIDSHRELSDGLERHGLKQARRATRLVVEDLGSELIDGSLWLEFSLRKGGYATSVLREIVA